MILKIIKISNGNMIFYNSFGLIIWIGVVMKLRIAIIFLFQWQNLLTDVSVTLRPPCWCPSEGHQHGVSMQSSKFG